MSLSPKDSVNNADGFSTRAVHGGERRPRPGNAITNPVFQTATFTFENTAELYAFFRGETEREAEYGRYGNPTQAVAERKLAALEGAEAGLLFSSGMSAITITILAMLKSGDHIVFTDDCYRRTRQFARVVLAKFGITHVMVEPSAEAIEAAIRPNTKLIITESPTNPYLNVVDLEKVAAVAKKHKIKTLIDATFATPLNQRPLEFGIDLVTHSTTKYLNGHNDVLGGVLLGKEGLISAIKDYLSMMGAVPDPHACYLLLRGLKTFALRVDKQNQNGQAVAQYLEKHSKIKRVYYPGLASHPTHRIAAAQMTGFGGVVSFEVDSDLDGTSRFIDATRLPHIAPSLGGVETLIEQPALMSFFELSTEQRLELGIKNNLVRMALGVEDSQDIIADLDQALGKI